MTSSFGRDFVAQVLIALSVCIGAWMLLVKPKAGELARLQQQISDDTSSVNLLTPQTIEAAAKRMERARGRLAQIEAANRLGDDSSQLYSLIMDLADEHGVEVQSLQPTASGKPAKESQVITTKLDLIVDGPYEKVAAFLDDVCHIDAFIKPLSLQLTPTTVDGKPIVSASFGCAVLKFVTPDSLAASGDRSHGKS